MRWIFLLSLFVGGIAAAVEAPDYRVPADIADAARQFPRYAKMLKEPKSIGVSFGGACAPGPDLSLLKKMGPHHGFYVQHYRNNAACASPGNGPWPVGSILVKEKYAKGLPNAKVGEMRSAGIAGMIKRAPGTKPETGDWEFFWVQDEKVKTSGMQSCAGCHSGAARDYVFTNFPTDAEKLQDAGKLNPR